MSAAAAIAAGWEPPARAVVMGGSAGALEALSLVLPGLSEDFTLPVIVLVHLRRHRRSALAEALHASWPGPIREPEDKEPVAGSTLYLAPPDYHLLVDPGPAFALSVDRPVHHSIPSIDLLFGSAAWVIGPGLAAVLLSGASADGALGLREVEDRGGLALVQDPVEATSPTMPEAGRAICPRARVLRAREIPGCLREFAQGSWPMVGGGP